MKFQAPEGCTDVNIGGENFAVDKKGQITTPDIGDYASLLFPHGFTVAEPDVVKVDDEHEKLMAKALATTAALKQDNGK